MIQPQGVFRGMALGIILAFMTAVILRKALTLRLLLSVFDVVSLGLLVVGHLFNVVMYRHDNAVLLRQCIAVSGTMRQHSGRQPSPGGRADDLQSHYQPRRRCVPGLPGAPGRCCRLDGVRHHRRRRRFCVLVLSQPAYRCMYRSSQHHTVRPGRWIPNLCSRKGLTSP